MDVPRKNAARNRLVRRIVIGVVAVGLAGAMTLGLSKMKPAAPEVDGSTVWPDTVKRGPMLRDVRGLGTLVPEEILFVPAISEGRVERIHMRAGAIVQA